MISSSSSLGYRIRYSSRVSSRSGDQPKISSRLLSCSAGCVSFMLPTLPHPFCAIADFRAPGSQEKYAGRTLAARQQAHPHAPGGLLPMGLTRVAIYRPVAIVMMFAALAAMGVVAYTHLPVDRLPKISFPFVRISVSYPGAAPEDVETLITKPLEDAI